MGLIQTDSFTENVGTIANIGPIALKDILKYIGMKLHD